MQDYVDILEHKIYDPRFRSGMKISYDTVCSASRRTEGKFLKRVLKDRIGIVFEGLQFSRQSWLYWPFEDNIAHLISAGIIDFYTNGFYERYNPNRFKIIEDREPKVLTMEHLEASFVVWVSTISFAIVAFIGEWICRFILYFTFKSILSIYFDQKLRENFNHELAAERIEEAANIEEKANEMTLEGENLELIEVLEEF